MSPSRPSPPKAVVDTDVLVSGAGAFARPAAPNEPIETTLLRCWMDKQWIWIASAPLLAEYQEILLRRDVPQSRVGYILTEIGKRAKVVSPRRVSGSIPDPEDAHVIGTALESGAPILTRNTGHYPSGLVAAITPEQMMDRIRDYLSHPMYRPRR